MSCKAEWDWSECTTGVCPECGADVDSCGEAVTGCWESTETCSLCGAAPCDGSCWHE